MEVVGNGPNARSKLEHRWSFEVTGIDPVDFHRLAQVVNPDSDTFDISYSIDGGSNWSAPLFTVDSTTMVAYSAPLPAGTSGSLIIRAVDTNRDRGETNPTGLAIDRMFIRSTKPATIPSPEPHPLFLQTLGGLVVGVLARRRRLQRARD